MKKLLIILSFLLLSSFLTSCEKKEGTLYKWGKYPPYVWKGVGDKETHPKYEGDVENGKPNGLGFLIYPWGEKYIGEFKDGVMNGQGTFTYLDGGKYEREFKGGERNGQGTFTWKDGEKFVGEWMMDVRRNGTGYDKNGNITYKYVYGTEIIQ